MKKLDLSVTRDRQTALAPTRHSRYELIRAGQFYIDRQFPEPEFALPLNS